MIRISLFDGAGRPLGDLAESDGSLRSCVRTEEINGEHSLSIVTERRLDVGTRAVYKDASGKWHEFVLDEPEETHDTGPHAMGTYHFVWSLQYDLQGVCGKVRQPGMKAAANASTALSAALDGTTRWAVGTTDVTTRSGCIMAYDTAWDRLSAVVKYWGGEIESSITVGSTGVTARKVNLKKHVGSTTVSRRFEWDHSLTSVKRTPDPGPYFCRIIPYGAGESEYSDDGVTTYDVRLTIAKLNGGRTYLQDDESASAFRVKANGTWEYPTCVVEFSTDDERELLQLAKADLRSHTRPSVSYEGSVSQFAAAGMNVGGVRLGDEVQVVDRGFNPDAGLRVQARVLRMEIDELGVEDIQLGIGRLSQTLEKTMAATIKAVGTKPVAVQMPDTSAKPVAVPTLPVYEVTKPSTGELVAVPTTSTSPTSYTPLSTPDLSSLESRVGALERGGVGYGHGDGWVHMIDGVTHSTGVIDFVTSDDGTVSSYDFDDPEEWGT